MSLVKEKEFDIRYSKYPDIFYLKEFLWQKSNAEYYSASNEKELDIIAKNWIGFYRFKASLTAVYKEIPVGFATLFLMPYKKVSHLSMLQLVVDERFQKRGVGSSLLRNIEHHAKREFHLDSIHLEVLKGAPIERLLEKNKYEKLFEQDDYFYIHGKLMPRVLYEKSLEGVNIHG